MVNIMNQLKKVKKRKSRLKKKRNKLKKRRYKISLNRLIKRKQQQQVLNLNQITKLLLLRAMISLKNSLISMMTSTLLVSLR